MENKVDQTKCVGCGACMSVCPVNAISINNEGKAQIDQTKCIKCCSCNSVCPMSAINME